jgi:hypothetical protein
LCKRTHVIDIQIGESIRDALCQAAPTAFSMFKKIPERL